MWGLLSLISNIVLTGCHEKINVTFFAGKFCLRYYTRSFQGFLENGLLTLKAVMNLIQVKIFKELLSDYSM